MRLHGMRSRIESEPMDQRHNPEFGRGYWRSAPVLGEVLPPLSPASIDDGMFRLLADAIPTLCWVANGDGYIVWYNKGWHAYCGSTPAAMEGWGWTAVHDPTLLPAVMSRWTAAIVSGEPFEMTFPLLGADGVFRPFLTRVQPVRDATGQIARWFGVNTDVTDQVAAERALAVERDRSRDVIQNMGDGFVLLDPDFRVVEVNARALPMGGRTREEILGKVHAEVWPGSEAAELGRFYRQAMRDRRPAELEQHDISPEGGVAWIEIRAYPSGDGLAVFYRDITGRKETEAALRDSEARFRAIADSMPQMVWSTLPDGYHDYYNARWYAFTGVPVGSTDGEAWNDLLHPDDRKRAWDRWCASLATGEPYDIEYRLRHHGGTYRWTLGRALPIRDDQGRITRWFGTCTDIDDAKHQVEHTELLSLELSHRIKNIFSVINAIIGLSVRYHPAATSLADDLRQRIAALGRAHDLARPHGAASQTTVGQTTVGAMLAGLFEAYPAYDDGRLSIAGEAVAVDDRAATPLALVFHELATNATKYGALSTPDGTVRIEVRREGGQCRLTWREQGGPPVGGDPTRHGFGSRLTVASVEGQLRGQLSRAWLPEGLVFEMTVPVANLTRSGQPAEA